jgi:predicted AAA+ superfamily ATPase
MLAHYHGQIWNASELSSSMGVSSHTTRRYLEALEQTYMVRVLQPWHENQGKRLVKSPKVYIRDSGMLHALLGVEDYVQLHINPKLGASWEGFALEEVLRAFRPDQAWFYRVHSGAELDLMFVNRGRRIGFEFKREDAPGTTKSMQVAIGDLGLSQLFVVYPGDRRYTLGGLIEAIPLSSVYGLVAELAIR